VSLARDPATITLRQMIQAVEGPIYLNRCLVRRGECPRDTICPVHPVWARIQAALLRELDAVTARDLAAAPAPAGARPAVA
jgi:DNA-binding IscR family transcriptional regulator